MRIISAIALAPVLWNFLFPQSALAAGAELSNETKIKFELDEKIVKIPFNHEGYEPIDDNFKNKFIVNASAYTAAADECGKSDGITASGKKVKENHTIACPREFPFGTKIRIDGMGTYVCEDRGGAIKGNKIDIYMETKSEAFAFGRRNLPAEVVE